MICINKEYHFKVFPRWDIATRVIEQSEYGKQRLLYGHGCLPTADEPIKMQDLQNIEQNVYYCFSFYNIFPPMYSNIKIFKIILGWRPTRNLHTLFNLGFSRNRTQIMIVYECNGKPTFSWGERWSVPSERGEVKLIVTFHLSLNENILTIARNENNHYLFSIIICFIWHCHFVLLVYEIKFHRSHCGDHLHGFAI